MTNQTPAEILAVLLGHVQDEEQTIAAALTALDDYYRQVMLEIIGEDEHVPPTKPKTKLSKPGSIYWRNTVRGELRQRVNDMRHRMEGK